jgi:hypothetical protein
MSVIRSGSIDTPPYAVDLLRLYRDCRYISGVGKPAYPTIGLSVWELVGIELVKQVRIVAIHFGESKN